LGIDGGANGALTGMSLPDLVSVSLLFAEFISTGLGGTTGSLSELSSESLAGFELFVAIS
jgi:hypothetical protein